MAKKIKFALEMSNGEQVRNIDDLKEHFDVEKVVGYYLNGRLLTWLKDRYYEDEAQKVTELSKDDPKLHNKLCAIFGIEYEDEGLETEEIAWRTEHLNKLKQYTDDKEILSKVAQVAFDQEELSDLLDEGVNDIYLCANRFTIPLKVTDKTYIGVGKAVAVIRSDKVIDFDSLNIKFVDVKFDDKYQEILDKKSDPSNLINSDLASMEEKVSKFSEKELEIELKKSKKELEDVIVDLKSVKAKTNDVEISKMSCDAFILLGFTKKGNPYAMRELANFYEARSNWGEAGALKKSVIWYKLTVSTFKKVRNDYSKIFEIMDIIKNGSAGDEDSAKEWYKKAARLGNKEARERLATQFWSDWQ